MNDSGVCVWRLFSNGIGLRSLLALPVTRRFCTALFTPDKTPVDMPEELPVQEPVDDKGGKRET